MPSVCSPTSGRRVTDGRIPLFSDRPGQEPTPPVAEPTVEATAVRRQESDGSVFYGFWDHYKVGVQVTNITGSLFYTDMGFKDFHPRTNTIQNDRKYSFVIRTSW